jgi:hypothetical protein
MEKNLHDDRYRRCIVLNAASKPDTKHGLRAFEESEVPLPGSGAVLLL